MHIPDGFIDGPTSVAAGAVAVAASGSRSASPGARSTRIRRRWPGSSPPSCSPCRCSTSRWPAGPAATCSAVSWPRCWSGRAAGALCVSVVLVVQALLFADGGLTALGLNIVEHGLRRPCSAATASSCCCARSCRARPPSIVVAAGVAAGISVVLASAGLRRSSTPSAAPAAPRSRTVVAAMVGVHTLIGIGEGVITALTVGAVLAVPARPGLRRRARSGRRRRARLAAGRGEGPRRPLGRSSSPRLSWRWASPSSSAPRPAASPTGSRRWPSTRASSRPTKDHALADGPTGRLRGRGRRQRAAQHRRWPGSSGCRHVRGRRPG